VIDQTASTAPEAAAGRRVFRSKADDLRPTYGFEDVSLAPGTDTIERRTSSRPDLLRDRSRD
jgi:hypothetical protein